MTKEEIEKIYNDPGCFHYTKDSFTIRYEDFNKSLQWDEITELVAFKTDLANTDRIDMNIVYGDKYFTISEEIPGWYRFINHLDEVFPSILKNWEKDILHTVSAGDRTVIYQRN